MNTETDILARLRKDYQAQGYSFTVRPRLTDQSGALLQPDAMAEKGSERILIGLRAIGAGGGEPERLQRLAEAADANDGWSLRLVLAEGRGAYAEPLPELTKVKALLADVRRLMRGGDDGPALLLAWSLLEGAAQRRLEVLGRDRVDFQPAQGLARDLIAHGLARQDDLALLDRLALTRNRLAHGFIEEPVARADLDALCGFVDGICSGRRGDIDERKAPRLSPKADRERERDRHIDGPRIG